MNMLENLEHSGGYINHGIESTDWAKVSSLKICIQRREKSCCEKYGHFGIMCTKAVAIMDASVGVVAS